jgi:hypothetical protein
MWIIKDASTKKEVGRLEEYITDEGDFFVRATAFGATKDFHSPSSERGYTFARAQAWVETQEAGQ